MPADKAEAQQQLEQLKKEIHVVSVQLKELGEQKEAKYKEKEKINEELNGFIKEAKGLRDKKADVDKKIRELKAKRQSLNKESSGLFSKLRDMKSEIEPAKRDFSNVNLQKQIEKIEFAIQTEALSFEREKKLMGQLKELKARLNEIKARDAKLKEVRDFRENVNTKKTEADTIHDDIQKLAVESSDIFKKLTEQSENIAKAKQVRENMNKVLQDLKNQISDVDTRLADLLQQWGELTSLPVFAERDITASEVQKKAEHAMEKLKTHGKLTKEDLLALQGQNLKRK